MKKRILHNSILLLILLASCAPSPAAPTLDVDTISTRAIQTALAALQPTATSIPTDTPAPSPTPVRTPPALSSGFTTSRLNTLDIPHTYISDTCQYLHDKWDTNNAAPGTVAMVVMFHGIVKDAVAENPSAITAQDFKQLMNDLKEQG
ncbi:MAG TPA: hypothetical protein DCX53_00615, partial [Anaerolineae bacterium]|nr:hypothetical protein [Anaerolineae bacterium]